MSDPYAELINTFYTLTGAPLTVLLAVSRAPAFGYSAGMQWLRLVTGLTDKTITRSAALLEAQKMVVRSGSAWELGDAGQAVIALLAGPLPMPPAAPAEAGTHAHELAPAPVEPEADRNFFSGETGCSSSGSRSLTTDSRKESLLPPLDSREPQNEKNSETARIEQNLALLQHYGIGEPKRTQLARMPEVTPEMIRYHCETTESSGQAVYRIQCHWRAKPAAVDPFVALAQKIQQESEESGPEEDPPLPEWAAPAWDAALARLSQELGRAEFNTWVNSLRLVDAQEGGPPGGRLWTAATGNFYGLEWLEKNQIAQKLEAALGGAESQVKFVVIG
jgi:hypothetical protein